MARSAEQYLISSVLNDKDIPKALSHGVSTEMFHAYPDEWEWLEQYYLKHRKSPSRLAFKSSFKTFRILDSHDTEHFADQVKKSHAKHLILGVLDDVGDFIADDKLDEAISKMHSGIIQAAAKVGVHRDTNIFSDFGDIVADIEGRAKRVAEGGLAGIPTGCETFDQRTGGLQPGWFGVVAARLGEFKSWTLTAWAAHAAMKGYTVQYDALEMTRPQVAMRIHNLLSGSLGHTVYNAQNLGRGTDFDIKRYKKFVKELESEMKGRLHVSDKSRGSVTPLTIAAQIERNNPDVVFIDYITLMGKKGDGDWRSVGQLSEELQSMSKQYGIPVVVAAQLNREHGLSKNPAGAEAISQSDNIGQDADFVVTQKKLSASVLQQFLAKFRHGVSGFKWHIAFQPDKGTFEQVSYQRAMDLKDRDDDEKDAEQD